MKDLICFDTECYRNYWLLMFQNLKTGNRRYFELYPGSDPLPYSEIRQIFGRYTVVSFNGMNYDVPMISYALAGATNDQLKTASDAIINANLKPWDFEREFRVQLLECDHIDIFQVTPGQVKTSLKAYGGRLHSKKMQDLPLEPGAMIEPERRPFLREYCGNDLATTAELFNFLKPQIDLRIQMSKKYRIDLRSKSDAQIAEAVITKQVAELTGKDVYRPPCTPGTTFKYAVPDFISFTTPDMQRTLKLVQDTTFMVGKNGNVEMPDSLNDYEIEIGNGVYRLGIGGLHSSEETATYQANADHLLVDFDVASYYPAIILNLGLYPEHIGPEFLTVYRNIVNKRLEAKASGDKVTADALKITINGSFGKFGSKWSKLYSPKLLIQTTITGQLALLMLIELLEELGLTSVVSANTDGVVVKVGQAYLSSAHTVVAAWEKKTGFKTENNQYRALYSRDVNNYIAVKSDGSVKTKGAYAESGLMKNPTNEICVEAVIRFLTEGVPVQKTIRECKDIRRFVTIRNVEGGAVKDDQYLGRAARWYYSTQAKGVITYKTNGNTVARSEGAMPCMELPDALPQDIDYDWYIREAISILTDIGYCKEAFI